MEKKQSMVKDGNYFVVQSFMVKELKLKGLERDCYAIIYGFSQEEGQYFKASLKYLSEWTCSTKRAVMIALGKLMEKGLLDKTEKVIGGVKFVYYRGIYFRGGEKSSIPPVKKVHHPSEKSSPNNIGDNIRNKITTDNKEDSPSFHSVESKNPTTGREGRLGGTEVEDELF